jgi:light-regulated signal transduction histidine kinase (bacteriophytochrome)
MNEPLVSPPFGQADLTNCERELIHLAGSIQPHGVLLVLQETDLTILQASANAGDLFGLPTERLLGTSLSAAGGNLVQQLRQIMQLHDLAEPRPLRCNTESEGGRTEFEGIAHRHPAGGLILELEPQEATVHSNVPFDRGGRLLQRRLATAVHRFSSATSIAALSEAVVQCFRELAGYDRVMVYKFDPDGHGEIVAEARDPKLESFLGLHYPSSDIPQRARELYIRNRVRVLVDVHYEPVPIVPRRFPVTGDELDMSLCYLRSMSPLHLQYLKNMGVTATMVVSLVREGRLWGLIACHHYSSKRMPYALRAASELLGEVISTRITAIENYVRSQAEVLVRRLEQRLMEATSTEGDWRQALFRNPQALLQPMGASGAALFYDGEILTAGEVPSTPELRLLSDWVAQNLAHASPFVCSSVARASPALKSMTPLASGVLAIEISRSRPDYLMWFRKEQLCTVNWAGDPAKPVIGNDPLQLSPRRSFAVWSEIVRETAAPWTPAEIALARAIGASLTDIILQIQAVRLLIAQHHVTQVRLKVESSKEPVVIIDAAGRVLYSNEVFLQLLQRPHMQLQHMDELVALFSEPEQARKMLLALRVERRAWRGELELAVGNGQFLPVAVRADVVHGQSNVLLGFIVIFTDLTNNKRAEAARRKLETSLSQADRQEHSQRAKLPQQREGEDVIGAILANASLAALEISGDSNGEVVAPMLQELEASAKRAAALYGQMRDYSRGD